MLAPYLTGVGSAPAVTTPGLCGRRTRGARSCDSAVPSAQLGLSLLDPAWQSSSWRKNEKFMCATKNQTWGNTEFPTPASKVSRVGMGGGSYFQAFLPPPAPAARLPLCPSHSPGGGSGVGLPCSFPMGGELALVGVGGLHARIRGARPVPRGRVQG